MREWKGILYQMDQEIEINERWKNIRARDRVDLLRREYIVEGEVIPSSLRIMWKTRLTKQTAINNAQGNCTLNVLKVITSERRTQKLLSKEIGEENKVNERI